MAVFANRLGVEASYAGVFGSDELGVFLRAAIEAEGVSTERSIVRDGETGVSTLRVDDGDRVFLGWNGGGVTVREPVTLDETGLAQPSGFDLVHSSVYSGVETELPRLHETGVLVSYDLSSEPEFRSPDYLDRVAPHLDLALVSCSGLEDADARALLDEIVQRGASVALGTRGTHGALVSDGRVRLEAPARVIDDAGAFVDTMGCGDAFLAGFVVSLFGDGWSRRTPPDVEALAHALAAGADAALTQCFVEGAFGRGRPVGDAVASSMW
ncbi:sugar/nucleoside kinase (ribokinase family) [Agromyces terreus]|uniref:Sugar/nucleoside kinase (Ribokinase family) n=1 Tax=Agromyces terreus TaxID=424795 RepID=A0A9X2H0C8_9MICO|nr:sugar/nucleoside kinase (ribokinase family) [Agromyces terreus]